MVIGENTVLVTLTNYGYRLYTLNLLKSLASFHLDKKMVVVCMDDRCAALFDRRGYAVLSMNSALSAFCPWNTKGYDVICFSKLSLLHRILSFSFHALLVDGDVVFRADPQEDLAMWEKTKEVEVWIQNDSLEDTNQQNLCTGYLWIRSHPTLLALYDCESEIGRKRYQECAFDNNDQTYFNRFVKPHCRVRALPLSRYPNGLMYYQHADSIREHVVLVHFNWVHGHVKMAKMKEHKMWLLTEEEEY